MSEAELQVAVAQYLRMAHPDVMFHSDFGSGAKLRPYQAKIQKMQNGGRRAWPDLFIAQPKREAVKVKFDAADDKGNKFKAEVIVANGLFLELKKEGTRLKKKNGEWASDHIAEQAEVLEELRQKGYMATFAVGFDEATNIIDDYLIGKNGGKNVNI